MIDGARTGFPNDLHTIGHFSVPHCFWGAAQDKRENLLTEREVKLLGDVIREGRAVVVAANKLDMMSNLDRVAVREALQAQAGPTALP